MFDEIYKKIDRIISFFTSDVVLESVANSYKQRLLDMKNIYLENTNLYSEKYYRYRVRHYNYTNIFHNYFLTGKFMNTLSMIKSSDNKIILRTEAKYYKYLLERFYDNVSISKRYELNSIVEDYKKFIKEN